MKRPFARVGCCLSWALATCTQTVSLAHAANLAPRDFAYGQPIVSPAAASVYSIILPLAIYQPTVRDDLGDLAIFNARGEVVPFFIRQVRTDAGWSSETAQAREDARGDYVFDLDGHVPVERVDLRLAEANSVMAADLPLAVPLSRDRYWLARIPKCGKARRGGASRSGQAALPLAAMHSVACSGRRTRGAGLHGCPPPRANRPAAAAQLARRRALSSRPPGSARASRADSDAGECARRP